MTVRGFGVPNQGRSRLRNPLNGEYKGYKWVVEFTRDGVFEWSVSAKFVSDSFGVVRGHTPPRSDVATALMEIREAVGIFQEVEKYDRPVTQELADQINALNRWKRMALQGRLTTKLKRRKDGTIYYSVEER